MKPSVRMFVLFCMVALPCATQTNDGKSMSYDMRGKMLSPDMSITDEELESMSYGIPPPSPLPSPRGTMLSPDMSITDEELELVYKDVENTFVEAGHHEAAASLRAEWAEVAESISRRRLKNGFRRSNAKMWGKTKKVGKNGFRRSNAKNWDIDGGATGYCRNNKGRYAECILNFQKVVTRINQIDTFKKAQSTDYCIDEVFPATKEDCAKIDKKPCDTSAWNGGDDNACVIDQGVCTQINVDEILVWGKMVVDIVSLVFTGGASAMGGAAKSTMQLAKGAAKTTLSRQLSGKGILKLGKKIIQSAPNAVRASGFASIKLAAKHAGKKGWYNFKSNIADHVWEGGMTTALKEKLAEEVVWMSMIGEPATLKSIVTNDNVPEKAAWELAAVVDPTGIASVIKFYKDRSELKCVFEKPPLLDVALLKDLEAFNIAVDRYEPVDENVVCSSVVNYSGSNVNRGLFTESLGRRYASPEECASSKAMQQDCSSGRFQHNRETQTCQCCGSNSSLNPDTTEKWNVYKLTRKFTTSVPSTTTASSDTCTRAEWCDDSHQPHCQGWADIGECDANPGYMHQCCKRECGLCDSDKCPAGWMQTFGENDKGGCLNSDKKVMNVNTISQCASYCANDIACVAFDFSADNTCYLNSKCPAQNPNEELSCTREPPQYCPSGYERRKGYSTKIIGDESAHDAFKRRAKQPYGCKEESSSGYGEDKEVDCKPMLDADALRIDSFDDLPTGHTALNINDCAKKCDTTSGCNAFEYSETTRYCYMFKDPEPESTSHELDFMFCAKPMDVTSRLNILGYKDLGSGECHNNFGETPYGVWSDLLSMSECISHCEEETYCTGIAMTTKDHSTDPNRCYMYGEKKPFGKKYGDYMYEQVWDKSYSSKSGLVSTSTTATYAAAAEKFKMHGWDFSNVISTLKSDETVKCWVNPDYLNADVETCRDKTPIPGSWDWNFGCGFYDNAYPCGDHCCCTEGSQYDVNDPENCNFQCTYALKKETVTGNKPRDNDQCLRDSRSDRYDWTCSDREDKCSSLKKTMYRCCPETCGNGFSGYIEAMCENINSDGECKSPSKQITEARSDWQSKQGQPYKYKSLKEKKRCTQKSTYGFGKFPGIGGLKTCAKKCYESSRCSTFGWSRDDGLCTDEGLDGGHNCPEWRTTAHTNFYQLYVGCGDMLPIVSSAKWEWWMKTRQGTGVSSSWESGGSNSYKCGDFYCCNKGYEANWEGTCVRTENCGATCTFSAQGEENHRIDAIEKVEKADCKNNLDKCGKDCLNDPTCFGFEFCKKGFSKGQCFHSKRNTLKYTGDDNWDAWVKICSYENGDPGYFQSSATAESEIDIPVHFSLPQGFALIGFIFILYSCKNWKKRSEYVDVPSGKEPQEI